MIDADKDHDETTQTGVHSVGATDLLSPAELAELAGRAQGHSIVTLRTETLAELVRIYGKVAKVAHSLDHISRIGDELAAQVNVAELVAESVLNGAKARFEILLRWGRTQAGASTDATGWHCRDNGLRWRGSFDEAQKIVEAKYGPRRGTEAFIVVRIEEP